MSHPWAWRLSISGPLNKSGGRQSSWWKFCVPFSEAHYCTSSGLAVILPFHRQAREGRMPFRLLRGGGQEEGIPILVSSSISVPWVGLPVVWRVERQLVLNSGEGSSPEQLLTQSRCGECLEPWPMGAPKPYPIPCRQAACHNHLLQPMADLEQ